MENQELEQEEKQEEEAAEESENTEDTKEANDQESGFITFLALGDSYTIGESVAESSRWPVQLGNRLRSDSIHIAEPRIIATTGWTTDELIRAVESSTFDETYGLVSLLIGVNNQYRGYPIGQQEREFEILLKKAISFADNDVSKVFVVSIPDYGVTPFGRSLDTEKIAKEIDEYNNINKQIAAQYQVAYFDITPISREAKDDESLVASDGLHPSGSMYKMWVDLIYPWASKRLKP
ncbi:MAG: SGNH/GDSL hydrolase family protein [Cyclobacteriaceae bacterium]